MAMMVKVAGESERAAMASIAAPPTKTAAATGSAAMAMLALFAEASRVVGESTRLVSSPLVP
jgi:hypothetical protein